MKSHAFANLRMSFSAATIASEPVTLPRRFDQHDGSNGNLKVGAQRERR
jgi:hypothetical protein